MLKHLPSALPKALALLLLCFFLFASLNAQTVYYVKTTGSDAANGTSWNTAFKTLQQALTTVGSNSQIWVAKGTYYSDEGGGKTNNDRSASFVMKNNVAIYGGFTGTETQLAQRDWKTNSTVLSGEIQQDGNLSNNSNHVVKNDNNGLNNTAVLDGFTITLGFASGNTILDYFGGGLFNNHSSPALVNIILTSNHATAGGGGMYNESSSPTLTNCSFSNNSVSNNLDNRSGGGICNVSSSPILVNCSFSNNFAAKGGGLCNVASSSPILNGCNISNNNSNTGGGIHNDASSPSLTNCIIYYNTASMGGGGLYNQSSSSPTLINCILLENRSNSNSSGGAMYNNGGSPIITNCSFSGNTAATGGALYNNASSPVITNSILWGDGYNGEIGGSNAVISYSLVQGQNPAGTGNLNGTSAANNPLFVQQPNYLSGSPNPSNLRLQRCSPAINKGNNAGNNTATDLDTNNRKFGTIDLGAYEYQGTPFDSIVYVNVSALGANNGSSWTNAYTKLQDALLFANTCSSVKQIWVAKGTYYPDEGGGKKDNDSSAAFVMNKGQAIYGGFLGIETKISERNWKANVTILSGDIDQNDGANFANINHNSNHVIRNLDNGLDGTAVLDGFSIGGGYARNSESDFDFNNMPGGGGLFNFKSSPSVSNCVFAGNYSYYYGGGIYNLASLPKFTNCIISGNRALAGGGMYSNISLGIGSSPVFTNCIFSGNYASSGGGVFNGSSITITNCTFSGNMTPTDNNGLSSGCAIQNSGGVAVITNSILYGDGPYNYATFPPGYPGPEIGGQGQYNFTYSLVHGMYPAGAGNVDARGNSIPSPFFASQPNYSSAPSTAGDLHVIASGTLTIDKGDNGANTTTYDLDNNPRKMGVIDMGAYERQNILHVDASATGTNNGTSWANAYTDLQVALALAKTMSSPQIWVAKGTYYPTKDTTGGNAANAQDKTFRLSGDVQLYGGFPNNLGRQYDFDFSRRNPQVYETILDGNNTSYHVIYNSTFDDTAVLDGFTIKGGKANGTGFNGYGGGLLNVSSSPAIANCTFTANNASAGGAIFNYNSRGPSNPTIRNCTFKSNVSSNAGAIYNHYCFPAITGSTFDHNGGNGIGGAIINQNSSPYIGNCNFTWNQTSLEGGGVYNISSPAVFDACTFSFNSATSGGAMLNESSSPAITNCVFDRNGAQYGGAIYNKLSSAPKLTYCYFSVNHCTYKGGAILNESSSPQLTWCTFSQNESQAGDGGAVYNQSSSPLLSNCFLNRNISSGAGGGMFNRDASAPQLTNCIISGNKAGTRGGGISSDTSAPVLVNCVLSGNKVTAGNGGAMYNKGGSPILTNCSFTGNNATSGGALYNTTSSPAITNCILWGDGGGGEIVGTNAVVTYSIVQGGYAGTGNLNQDPRYSYQLNYTAAPTTDNDVRLTGCSGAFNSGNNSTTVNNTTVDLDGNSRRVGIIDMGAYEYKGPFSGETDYFRSTGAGTWNTGCVWESSANNSTWMTATQPPGVNAKEVIIRNGHVITVTQNTTTKKVTVNAGGTLNVQSSVGLTTQ